MKAPTKNGSNGHWPPILATDGPHSPRRPKPAGTVADQRQRSRRILALLEGKPPLYALEIQKLAGQRVAIGSYLRNGYLRQVGDKYSRTSKPFVLSAWEAKKKAAHAALKADTPTRKPMSKATRRKLALAMKKRHASGDIARAKAAKTHAE